MADSNTSPPTSEALWAKEGEPLNRAQARANVMPERAQHLNANGALGQAEGEEEKRDSMGTCMDNVKIARALPCFGGPFRELFTGNVP